MKRKKHLPFLTETGFTIVELLISLFILSFIALTVYQNTTQSFKLRDDLETEGDFYNALRVGLEVLHRDLSHLYSPQLAGFPSLMNQVPQPTAPGPSIPVPGQGTPPPKTLAQPVSAIKPLFSTFANPQSMDFWSQPLNGFGIRMTRFEGSEKQLQFVTNAHMRLFKDMLESDFAQITYFLNNKGALTKKEEPQVFLDHKESKTAVEYELIPQVRNLKFEFLDPDTEEWKKEWDNVEGDNQYQRMPALIKMSLSVPLPHSTPENPRLFSIEQLFRTELPL